MLRRAGTTVTDAACRAVGRRRVVRAARFVLLRARLDVQNGREVNGEASLVDWMLDLTPVGHTFHVVDVGANLGQWANLVLAAAGRTEHLAELDLHSFEPSSYTFSRLSEALAGQHATLNQAALGDRAGSAILHVVAPGAGTNSLHMSDRMPADLTTEVVPMMTLAMYANEAGLDQISLVKIDTEGHDLAVLRGAESLFAEHRISVAQFEYNHRWIYPRFFLRDAFKLLEPLGYRIGKLTPFGIEFYPGWDPELETFVEGNYVACAPLMARKLPSISWWKSDS
jgi:FkbM family methyltransferase